MTIEETRPTFTVPKKQKEIAHRMSEEGYFRDMSEFFEYNIGTLTETGKYRRWDEAEARAKELSNVYNAFPEDNETRRFLYDLTEEIGEKLVYNIAEEYSIHRWIDGFDDLESSLSDLTEYNLGK